MSDFGLVGKKLNYSYSKLIHEDIFYLNNLDYNYDLIELNEDEFDNFFKNDIFNYKGVNITIPYKEKVLKYLDELDESVVKLNNCNTVKVINNKLVGYNTDYYGFLELLKYYKIDLKNKIVRILGTGGAAKTCYAAVKNFSDNVKFVSRNKLDLNTISYSELENEDVDVIINATPKGMNDLIDVNAFDSKKVSIAIDLIYNPKITKFLDYNNSIFNGLPMLIYQAYKADCIWISGNLKLDYKRIEAKIYE